MQSHKDSIAIFHKSIEYSENVSQPHTPPEVFEATRRVIESKGIELIRARDGIYIVQYSETGPFREKINDEWLPVFVMRLQKYSSGGVKRKELNHWENSP